MPAKKSDFTAAEIKAGLLVVASVAVLVLFVAAVRGFRTGAEDVTRYTASFTNISGLNANAEVRFGGVEVGRVAHIEPDPENRTRIRVTVEVRDDIPVNRDSVATVEQISLTAEKHLEISTGSAEAELLQGGDEIAARTTGTGLIDMSQLEGVTARLETLLDGLIVMVGGDRPGTAGEGPQEEVVDLTELMATLQGTLEDGAAAARELSALVADNRPGIGEVIDRLGDLERSAGELLDLVAGVVEDNQAPLNATLVNFERLSASLTRQIDELSQSLAASLAELESTGGNLGDFVDQQRPALEEIVRNLRDTTANLKRLSGTLARQPDAVIRGVRPQGRESGGER